LNKTDFSGHKPNRLAGYSIERIVLLDFIHRLVSQKIEDRCSAEKFRKVNTRSPVKKVVPVLN